PDARPHVTAWKRNADQYWGAVALRLRNHRQIEEIVLGIALLLPAVDVQVLTEVTLPVHEADADERQAEIAGRLQMISRQNTKTARIDRKTFMNSELGGEIADTELTVLVIGFLVPRGPCHVAVERFGNPIHVRQKA